MEAIQRNRILEKIQKSLNLAKDGAASPGEAAAALNIAQKMMAKYGIDEKELTAVGYGRERIQCPIQAGKKAPAHLLHMINLIKRAFGVKPIMEREVRVSDASWTINYFGPEHRVAMAVYTHQVMWRAMGREWQKHLIANPNIKGQHGARTGFYIGWIESVHSQVMALAMTPEEEAGTDVVLHEAFPSLSKVKAAKLSLDSGAMSAGLSAGNGFKLHRPVNSGPATLRLGN